MSRRSVELSMCALAEVVVLHTSQNFTLYGKRSLRKSVKDFVRSLPGKDNIPVVCLPPSLLLMFATTHCLAMIAHYWISNIPVVRLPPSLLLMFATTHCLAMIAHYWISNIPVVCLPPSLLLMFATTHCLAMIAHYWISNIPVVCLLPSLLLVLCRNHQSNCNRTSTT